jgi:GT2 family glycosyltransferase
LSKAKIDISIIIVNYNVKEFVLNLLESLKKAVINISTEIIIVDNASDDGSVEAIKEKHPNVKMIVNKKNVGFGAANNQAFEIASGNYFLLINPDTIVKENTLTEMIRFFEANSQVGIAGCKVLNPDGTLQLSCRRGFPGPWTSFTKVMGLSKLFPKRKLFAKYNLTYLNENETYEVDAVSGAFLMLRKEVYEKIGGFDKQFFMYGEDLDLCYRAQSEGFKVYYVHSTEVIHYKGESTKRSKIDETKIFYDAMHLFVKKHFSTSLIVEIILRTAIIFRKFFTFLNVYKLAISGIILDLLFFSLAIFLAEKVYINEHWIGFPLFSLPWVYFVPSVIQITISLFSGVYKKKSISTLSSIVSLFYGLIILSAATYFFKQFAFSRAVLLITYLFVVVFFIIWRLLVKLIFKYGLISGTRKYRTLIVGNTNHTSELALKLKSNVSNIYDVIGFISLSRKNVGESINGYKVIGVTENIGKIIRDQKIDKIVLSSKELSYDKMFSIVSECQGYNVEFMVSGEDMDYLVGKSSISILDDIPMLKVQYNISAMSNKITKKIFDYSFSLILIVFLIYPFVYLFHKIISKENYFISFILGLPKILKGEKSFVGPLNNSFYGDLFVGKTGLTGLWFVENISQTDVDELKKIDLFYAKNQNIWFDLEILGRTFSKMFIRTE